MNPNVKTTEAFAWDGEKHKKSSGWPKAWTENQGHPEYEAGVPTIDPRRILKYYEPYLYLYKYRPTFLINLNPARRLEFYQGMVSKLGSRIPPPSRGLLAVLRVVDNLSRII
jgi:hypothetical protein